MFSMIVALSGLSCYKYRVIKTTVKTLMLMMIMSFLQTALGADVTVIVNSENPVSSITSQELNDFFMKKTRSWPNSDAVRFFDHRDENMNRKTFLSKYIGKTSREIELYWIGEKIYTGNIAPIQITSDSMMTRMVSRFKGGIGYVGSQFKIPKTVKRITVVKSEIKE